MICFIAWGVNIAGGVQSLIINLTTQLSNDSEEVTIIGYEFCHIVKELRKNNINFVFVDLNLIHKNNLKSILENKVVIFTSFSPQLGLHKLREANIRALYWNVFPTRLKDANKIGPINLKFLTKVLVKYLFNNNSCVFMDKHGLNESINIFRNNYIVNKVNYLPIPIKIEKNYYKNNIHKSNFYKKINISYVGRGSNWKVKPFIKFINDLNVIDIGDTQIIFHIITQEPQNYKEQIEKIKCSENISFLYQENIFGEEYKKYLQKNIELHIAMGTAALDGASMGIPTIVIDMTLTEMPKNYKYRWLFETDDYDLGHDANKYYNTNGHEFTEIINPFMNNEIDSIETLSKKCFYYVKENHEISIIANNLKNYAFETKAYVKPILNLSFVNTIIKRYLLKIFPK